MSTVGRAPAHKSLDQNELLIQLLARPPKGGSLVVVAQERDEALRKGSKVGGIHPDLGRKQRILELGARALPEFPGTSVIPEIVVPPPALIDAEISEVDAARMLGAAYRAAISTRYPRMGASYFLLSGDPKANKLYPALIEASEALWERRVPPVAWCLFSFDCWADHRISDRPPAVAWVFARSRLIDRLQWFEDRRADYCTTRHVVSPLHRELLADWQNMWWQLLQLTDPCRPDVLMVVDVFFPGDMYEKRVRLAKTEVMVAQREVDILISQGGGLWR